MHWLPRTGLCPAQSTRCLGAGPVLSSSRGVVASRAVAGRLAWLVVLLALGCSARTPLPKPRDPAVAASTGAPVERPGSCAQILREADALAARGERENAQLRLLVACDEGVPSCCHEAALQHRKASGYLGHNAYRATQLFRLGCDRGHGPACRALGKPALLDRACLLGDVVACAEWKGPEIVGLALHARGCELGDRAACDRLRALRAKLSAVGEVEFWSTRDPRFDALKGSQGYVELRPFAFTASGRHAIVETAYDQLVALDVRSGQVAARAIYDPRRIGNSAHFVRHRVGSQVFFAADMSARDDGPQPTDYATFLRRIGSAGDTGWQRLQRGSMRVREPRAFSWDGRVAAGLVDRGHDLSHCPFGAQGVQRWDVATGKPLGEPVPVPAGVFLDDAQFDLSPDGQLLAVGGRHATQVEVWRQGEARPFATLPIEAGWVHVSAGGVVAAQKYGYDPGPRQLATLQLATGQLKHVPDAEGGAASYAPDADLLIFKQPLTRFFDRTGKPLGEIEAGKTRLDGVVSSPDGATVLATSAGAGVLRIQRGRVPAASAEDVPGDELAWFRQLRLPLIAPDPPLRPVLRDCGAIAADGEVALRVQEMRNNEPHAFANRTIELRPELPAWPVRGLAELTARRGRSDHLGQLRLTGLPRIGWTVHVLDASGRDGAHVTGDRVDLRDVTGIERVISFWLPNRTQAQAQVLTGTVTRPDGRPAAGARIEALGTGPTSLRETTADAQGRFSIAPKDVSWLRASLPDGHIATLMPEGWTKTNHAALALRAPGAPEVERLRFIDDAGTPLPAVEVYRRFGLVSDDQGRALETSCPKCGRRCDADRLTRHLYLKNTVLSAQGDVCEIRLPSARIQLDTGGVRYVPGLKLLKSVRGLPPWPHSEGNRKETSTGYEWSELPSGRYLLTIHDPDRGEHQQELDLAPGQLLQLKAPRMVATPARGRIVDDETGLPLTGFHVEIGIHDTTTDAQGRFAFPHVMALRQELRIGPTRHDTLYQRVIELRYRVPLELGTIRVRGVRPPAP